MFSRSALAWGLGLSALCVLSFLVSFEIRPDQLGYPIHTGGDVLQACRLLKSYALEGSYYQVKSLGAPFVADHYGFPETFVIHLPLVWLLSRLTDNIYLVYNVLYLATFVAAALSSFAVLRALNCQPLVAGGLSWIYAMLPNHLERYDHYGVSLYATAPLMLYFALLLQQDKRPGWKLCLLAPLGGLCGPYPALFGCLTLLLGGLLGCWMARSWRPLLSAVGLCALVSLAFLSVLAPALRGGGPDQAVLPYRSPSDLPHWSLSLDRLVLPAHARPSHPWAGLASRYFANFPPPKEANEAPYLGILCVAAWICLVLRVWRHPLMPHLLALSTGLFLLGMSGGLGQLLTLVLGTSIRCYNRLNFHLAFVLLISLALGLNDLCKHPRFRLAFVVLVFFGVVEQVRSTPPRYPSEARQAVASDRAFVRELEERLPPGAMLWQFPYVAYPESPPAFAEGDYGLGRLYAVSHRLHWSWGCLKGNRQERTQAAFSRLSLQSQVEILRMTGFAGVVVERRGFSDQGQSLESDLRRAGLKPETVSPDKNLVYYAMSQPQVCADPGPTFERAVWHETWNGGVIDFTQSGWGRLYSRNGWSDPEPGGTWTLGKSAWLFLPSPPTGSADRKVQLLLTPILNSEGRQHLAIFQEDQCLGSWFFVKNGRYRIDFSIRLPARLELRIGSPVQPSSLGGDDTRPAGIFLRRLEFSP